MTLMLDKKSETKKVIPKKVSPTKVTADRIMRSKKKLKVDSEKRHNMISEAAYYIAEKRGFEGASFDDDWYAAEAEIDSMLIKG